MSNMLGLCIHFGNQTCKMVRITELRNLPIVDNSLSKDDYIYLLHIASLRMKHHLNSNSNSEEAMLTLDRLGILDRKDRHPEKTMM